MKRRDAARALAAALPLWLQPSCRAQPAGKVRPAANAGLFYPADAGELTRMVDGLLAKAGPPALDGVAALVVPHAGYVYSGAVAAAAYALVKGRRFDRVIVIAPSHVEAFGFSSLYDGAAYATPLGPVAVDAAFATALAKSGAVRRSGRGHEPAAGRAEHAIEVQLPFLQRAIGAVRLVPIVMGLADYESCRELGLALAAAIQGPGTLIVASSDLSHYHPYEDAVRMDRNTLRAIQEFDYLSLSRNIDLRVWEACGGAPIVAAMIAAERLGARRATLLAYANSGDTSGDRRQVVGYGAVALHSGGSPAAAGEASFSLNADEREELLRVARASVESVVRMGRRLPDPAPKSEALAQDRGAFVTLRKNGELRGCIGYVAPTKPLVLTVRDVAAMAAVEDTRFRPVAQQELPLIDYEVSVISPMRRVLDVNEIVVGRHGLLVRRNGREGLLLPQVPLEEGWNRTGFLENACLKAGLPKDAWKDARTDIFSFTALVFSETKAAASPAIPAR